MGAVSSCVYRLTCVPGYLLRAAARVIDVIVDTVHWQWFRRRVPLLDILRLRQGDGHDTLEPEDDDGPMAVLKSWRELVNMPYDPKTHHTLLRRLWVASAFPEEEFATSSKRWTQIGFQSADPASDFRGGGVLSLKCIVYFAETYPEEYGRLCKERPLPSYYPFSASFVNVSFTLIDVLGIRNLGCDGVRRPVEDKCTYGFLKSVAIRKGYGEDDEHPFELAFMELTSQTMIDLDRTFEEERATYLDFPRVRQKVLDELVVRIGHRSFCSGVGAIGESNESKIV